jgi:hypothetical protein
MNLSELKSELNRTGDNVLNNMIVGVVGSRAILLHPDSSIQITKFRNNSVQMGDDETSKFRAARAQFDLHRAYVVRLRISLRNPSRSTRKKFVAQSV